ncbi:MAG: LOG family protein, partial [Saezia sp.]
MPSPQKNKPLSICVYCAARPSTNPVYVEVAAQVGHWLGKNNIRLVYGGGNTGLMGAIANAALESGAQVYGI